MSNRFLVPLLAIGLLFLGGWLLAQPAGPAPAQPPADVSRFALTPVGDTTVLLDSRSGKTWQLRQSTDGTHLVWLPIERIDQPEEAQQWLQKQAALQTRLQELDKQARIDNGKHTAADLEQLEKEKRRLLDEFRAKTKP